MANRPAVDGVIVDGETNALEKWLAPHARLGAIDGSLMWGAAEGTRSCVMAAVAAGHLAAGHASSILLVAARGASSVALVLERTSDR